MSIKHTLEMMTWKSRAKETETAHAETLRLLGESLAVVTHLGGTLAMMSSPDTRWESPMMERYRKHRDEIRAHLAAHSKPDAMKGSK